MNIMHSGQKTHSIRVGNYFAEVAVKFAYLGDDWGYTIGVDDVEKIERVRAALKSGDIAKAKKDADVFELNLHGRPGVKLKGKNSLLTTLRFVLVRDDRRQHIVDPVFEGEAFGRNVVAVPVFLLDLGLNLLRVTEFFDNLRLVIVADHRLLTAQCEDAAELFAVVDARVRVTRLEVGLVATDDPFFIGEFKAAVLNSRVPPDDFVVQLELKIGRFTTAPDEERVPFCRLLGRRLTGNRPLLDTPEVGVAIPLVERLPIEDRDPPVLLSVDRDTAKTQGQEGHQGHCRFHPEPHHRLLSKLVL